MSRYSQGYGQWPPTYPPVPTSQASPQGYPTAPSEGACDTNTAQNYYAVSQNAFEYNSSTIPGLGITAPSPGPPGGSWNRVGLDAQNPSPGFGQGQPRTLTSMPYNHPYQRQHPAPESGPSRPPAQENRPPTKVDEDDAMEEGELGEDDLDDLYDPAEPMKGISASKQYAAHLAVTPKTQERSTLDAQDEAFYEDEPKEGTSDVIQNRPFSSFSSNSEIGMSLSPAKSTTGGRERSGSYSPYLSPREIHKGGEMSDDSQAKASSAQPSPGQPSTSSAPEDKESPALSSGGPLDKDQQQHPKGDDLPGIPFKTVDQARKEAQKSILRLIPFGVKYQTYIEEGFDENVVRSLFTELGLKPPSPAANQTTQPTTNNSDAPLQESQPAMPQPATPQLAVRPATTQPAAAQPAGPMGSAKEAEAPKPEERKDRIARLLALKATTKSTSPAPTSSAKPSQSTQIPHPSTSSQVSKSEPTPQSQSTSQSTSISQPSVSAPATATTASDKPKSLKEQLLQQKMEALQKAREQRVTKTSPAEKTGDMDTAMATTEKSTSTEPQQAHPASLPTTGQQVNAIASQPEAPRLKTPQPLQVAPAMAAVPQAISPTPPPRQTSLPQDTTPMPSTNSRKRPVASDFVDYPTTAGPLKRPFRQSRQMSSLVIDVSDGSDDEDVEMEVDMDMDSPAEGPSTTQRADTPARNGPSIADFPPLSDGPPPRPSASSSSSVATPSRSSFSGIVSRPNLEELLRKEREIHEMKKKIAEAEARKASKTPVGAQTPGPASAASPVAGTPEPTIRRPASSGQADKNNSPSAQLLSEAISAKLPKRSDVARAPGEAKQEVRNRIASVQLPKVEAELREKAVKLKLWKDKVAKLEAEVDAGMAEKNRLLEEMRELGEDAGASTPAQPAAPGSASSQTGTRRRSQAGSTGSAPAASSVSVPPFPVTKRTAKLSSRDQTNGGRQRTAPAPRVEHSRLPTTTVPQQSVATHAGNAKPAEKFDPTPAPPTAPQIEAPANAATNQQESARGTKVLSSSGSGAGSAKEADPLIGANTLGRLGEHQQKMDTSEDQIPAAAEAGRAAQESASLSPGQILEVEGAEEEDAVMVDAEAETQATSPLAQISDVQIHDTTSEKQVETGREVHVVSSVAGEHGVSDNTQVGASSSPSAASSTFTPYVSPLQSFRSFRFHPRFKDAVKGGLRSLTFSARVQPKVALCPDDLEGRKCPRGDSCEFQHFESIQLKDDQILVELGKSDEFTGERKNRFVQGLREVLQKFRLEKVRDFDTIAYQIIEYRRHFLQDDSRVLSHLEGVSTT